jgi:hypothetical protein
MADKGPVSGAKASELEQAKVHLTDDNRLRVEFNIKELVRKLAGGGAVESNCGGCRGCMGCSM